MQTTEQLEIKPAAERGIEPQRTPEPEIRNGRWSGYRQLLIARMTELRREPEVVFWVFMFPLLLAFGLGIAFRNKPADIQPVAIVQNARASQALELIQKSGSEKKIRATILPQEQAFDGFRLGKFAAVIEPKSDGSYGFRYDPARPESVLALEQAENAVEVGAGRKNPVSTTEQVSSEPGARYIDFLIPGLLGMNLMNSAMWGIGFALVDMRQRKLLKRYLATPMRRTDFLMALVSSRLVLMLVEVGILLSFGVLAFHMRVLGSLLGILFIGAVAAVSFSGIGLLVASRAQKIETVSGLVNVVLMPMWVFSGVFFSYDRFPAALQPAIKALPLTALNDAFRATILEGAPLHAQALRMGIMLLWGGIAFLLALKWFRWT